MDKISDNEYKSFNLSQEFIASELDYSIAKSHAETLRHLESFSQNCYWIFDYNKNNFYYLSKNTDFFLDENLDIATQNGYDYFIRNTHPDDILYLLSIHKAVWEFFQKLPKNQCVTDYKVAYIIRLLNAKGHYVKVKQQVKLIATDKSGNLWLSVGMLEEVANELVFLPYISNIRTGERMEFSEIAGNKEKLKAPVISNREKEFLNYLKENLSQNEMANRMYISVHTLKNHRKNLYKKLNASDKYEAVKNAGYLGLFN